MLSVVSDSVGNKRKFLEDTVSLLTFEVGVVIETTTTTFIITTTVVTAVPVVVKTTKVGLEINTAAAVADENVPPAPSSVNSSRLPTKRTTSSKELGNVAVRYLVFGTSWKRAN